MINSENLVGWEERKMSRDTIIGSENPSVVSLSNWMESQLSLPKELDLYLLTTFVDWAGHNSKEFVSNYYKTRQHYRKLFRNRDAGSAIHRRFSSVVVASFTLPTTPDWIILGTWLADDDPAKFNVYHLAKLILTELDILLQEGCLLKKTVAIIMDMHLMTMEHIKSITRFAAKTIATVLLTAVPVQMSSIFLVNPPPFVSHFTRLFPALDFRFINDVDNLAEFIPRELLPVELGGFPDAKSRFEFAELFQERLWRHASWLADEEVKRVRELHLYSTAEDPIKENTDDSTEKKKKKKGKKKKKK